MIPVDTAIYRVRRDLTLSILLKAGLSLTVLGCMLVGNDNLRIVSLMGAGALWLWLSLTSARGSRAAAESPQLIASGEFEAAERNIENTVRTFSLFRTVKLQSLHHLAILRHAQRRWQESAALAKALLGQRLGPLQPLSKSTRLLLADSLLEMNDLRGTYDAIAGLYREPLSLAESLSLMAVQLDYSARIGAWASMMENLMSKVQLAELLPSGSSARAQGFLALAARRIGRADVADWLAARAALLGDIPKLIAERPMLRELWGTDRQEVP
ncbi:MAG TPA: hypothetical protein VIM11_03335 [Tepidisphaeraceae bacterium]|jgi:hypothetical protein